MEFLVVFLILCMACMGSSSSTCQQSGAGVFNVLDYGANGEGDYDDSKAFLEAWTAACGSDSDNSTLCIPEGKTFLLDPVKFQGPCKSSSLNVQVDGNIVAPEKEEWPSNSERWITFAHVNGLIVKGSGQIDGQGSTWWEDHNKQFHDSSRPKFTRPTVRWTSFQSLTRPTAMEFDSCNNLQLSGLKFINSPRNHISIGESTGVTISNLHITAPEDSPNTDGIDIIQSTDVQIYESVIGTGDDCIAINGGCSNINITGVACGPGHGISVGSLGRDGATDTVEHVQVTNCNFSGTMYGARIKTWQGGSGYARHISFKDIQLNEASDPILIDQYYCNDKPCKNETAAVQVSDITFEGFHGTSMTEDAIQLSCSETVACTDIVLRNINITLADSDHDSCASCLNAYGSSTDTNPAVDCLKS